MNLLSVTGLTFDLSGVLLLGFDLVRIQHRLRGDAENRISTLDEILEAIGGIEGWAETVPSDFQDWHMEEGRAVSIDGTFDPRQARESFEETLNTISAIGTHVLTLAKMQTAAIEADRSTANLSLRYSYLGLTFIILGFGLQLPAYF
jgi:hypothetical protein